MYICELNTIVPHPHITLSSIGNIIYQLANIDVDLIK